MKMSLRHTTIRIIILLALTLVMFTACTWTVQDTRTEEQKSADRTRVAESLPPMGTIRVDLLPQETPVPCLDIKGNISRDTGEKIYHMVGQLNYERTEVEGEGEAYFCTEEEARAAGFRKALK